ncbi:Clp protease ClpP, partial [Rhodovulum sulfidophilum]|nr:Clp protease ClpP [Rhodovulum sulfidophilum]
EQIRTILAGHPGGCRIVVEGIAASAASLLFMAGAERLMSAGSLLMIHDPSGAAWGTEEDLRREADAIGASANVYAAVYADASGKSPEEVRKIMKAETWYGPEAAIAAGFADAIVEDPGRELPPPVASIDRARAAFASAGQDLRLRLAKKPEPAAPARSPSAAPSGSPAATATAMEAHMPNDNPAA